jgi:flagellar biosynthesis/type III secretory pathway protein FliH
VPQLDIVLPIRIQRVEKTDAPEADPREDQSHSAGFAAGYEEGRLRAEWEAARQRQKDSARIQALTKTLENLHHEFETLLAEHLPDLVQDALNRVFRKHPFTTAEIAAEICALLHDMAQANRIALECAPSQAEELRQRLAECETIPDESRWMLEENAGLHPGEFFLKSDLGDVDGRHLSRIRQIHLALEDKS